MYLGPMWTMRVRRRGTRARDGRATCTWALIWSYLVDDLLATSYMLLRSHIEALQREIDCPSPETHVTYWSGAGRIRLVSHARHSIRTFQSLFIGCRPWSRLRASGY
jgi:hypothetical protein